MILDIELRPAAYPGRVEIREDANYSPSHVALLVMHPRCERSSIALGAGHAAELCRALLAFLPASELVDVVAAAAEIVAARSALGNNTKSDSQCVRTTKEGVRTDCRQLALEPIVAGELL